MTTASLKPVSTYAMIRIVLERPYYKVALFGMWLLVLTAFLWLPRLNLAAYVFLQSGLSSTEKIAFLARDIQGLIATLTSPLTLAMLLFSFLTALTILMLVFLLRTSGRMQAKVNGRAASMGSTAAAAIAAHVLSCGALLLLAPVIPFVFPVLTNSNSLLGTGASVNIWIGTFGYVAGIVMVIYSLRGISRDTARLLT